MAFEVDIRFDINLSIKQTQGGPQSFKVVVGIKMMSGDSGMRRWRQLGTADFRIPAHGSWDWLDKGQGAVVMKSETGEGFARLDGFGDPPAAVARGLARVYRPGTRTYDSPNIEWRATGTWTVLQGRRQNLPEVSPGFFTRWWNNIQQMNMQTDWKYDTCAGWSISAGAKYGGEVLSGDIWVRDTRRRNDGPRYKLHYWGVGGGVMTKGAGGAFSTASMPSTAISGDYVRRGPAAYNDPLLPSDFEGACQILDCGAGGTGIPIALPKVGALPYGKGGVMTNLMLVNFGVAGGVWLGHSRAWIWIWTPITIAGSVSAGPSASATLNIGKVTVSKDPG